jgi:hypothetical protein
MPGARLARCTGRKFGGAQARDSHLHATASASRCDILERKTEQAGDCRDRADAPVCASRTEDPIPQAGSCLPCWRSGWARWNPAAHTPERRSGSSEGKTCSAGSIHASKGSRWRSPHGTAVTARPLEVSLAQDARALRKYDCGGRGLRFVHGTQAGAGQLITSVRGKPRLRRWPGRGAGAFKLDGGTG